MPAAREHAVGSQYHVGDDALAVVDQHGGPGQIEPAKLRVEVDGRVQVLGQPLGGQARVKLGAEVDVGPRMDQVGRQLAVAQAGELEDSRRWQVEGVSLGRPAIMKGIGPGLAKPCDDRKHQQEQAERERGTKPATGRVAESDRR